MRMYVIVRNDLSASQKAVQAGHALAEYLLKVKNFKWPNGILIYLTVDNEMKLKNLMQEMDMKDINWIGFKEPDINNEYTAIAVETKRKTLFKNLPLL